MNVIHLGGADQGAPAASLEDLRLLPVAIVADLLGCSRNHVYQLIYSGELPVTHVGRAVRISATAVRAYIDKNTRR